MEIIGVLIVIWLLGVILAKLMKPKGVSTADFLKNYDKPVYMKFNDINNTDDIRIHDPLPDDAEDIEFDEFFKRLSKLLLEDGNIITVTGKSGITATMDGHTDYASLGFLEQVILMDAINGNDNYKIYRNKIYGIN